MAAQNFPLVVASRGYSPGAVHRFLTAVASYFRARAPGYVGSVVVAPRLWGTCSAVVAHRLSCSMTGGIFPDQGLTSVSCIGRRIL